MHSERSVIRDVLAFTNTTATNFLAVGPIIHPDIESVFADAWTKSAALTIINERGFMNKETAAELMEEIVKLSNQLNVIIHKIHAVMPEESRKELNSHMGPMMAACDEHLFRPILRHYPELDPHR